MIQHIITSLLCWATQLKQPAKARRTQQLSLTQYPNGQCILMNSTLLATSDWSSLFSSLFKTLYLIEKMKNRLKSSQSSRNEEDIERSIYESPRKPGVQSPHENMNEDMQYRLSKVFEQAGNREERYINLIKEQEQKLTKQSEQYLQSLKEIKKEFLAYIASTTKNEREQWQAQRVQDQFASKKSAQRFNSKQFSTKILKDYSKGEGRLQPELHCKIDCYYYTPLPNDIIRYQFPQNLILRIRNFYPNIVMSKDIKIVKEEDEAENVNCLINRVPFQICTDNNESILINFKIPCSQDAINHYRRKEFQFELVNKQGMFAFAYAKINLKSILFFEDQATEWQLKPVSFYSTLDGSKIGEMSVKFGNRLETIDKNEHYKIQSTTPMQINNIKSLINYNDEESRMIQRISKFKTNSNSLLLGIGSSRQAKAERFFESQNDKIILMHRQKKELESILEYKNSHKSELMDKLFHDAIDKFYLTECEIGAPKYVVFNYQNGEKNHRKLFAKMELTCKGMENQPNNVATQAIQENIQASLITPRQAKVLQQEELIELADQTHIDYEFDEEEQSLWAISGMSHSLIAKVICLPLKPSLSKEASLKFNYELKLSLTDEYNQCVQTFQTKIKIKQPSIENTLHIHGYSQTESELEIPFDQSEEKILKKGILTNIPDFQCKWNSNQTKLSVKINHQFVGEKTYYIIINDHQNLYSISSYQIVIYTYAKLTQSLHLQLGEVRKFSLEFAISQDVLTEKYKEIEGASLGKAKIGKDQIRMLFASSNPQHCIVTCQNQPELLCKLNKIYTVDAKVQSFNMPSNPQKILIHALDLDTNRVIKRWLLLLQKQSFENYKQTYKLMCEHGKPMKYKFQFINQDQKQKSFRFYSSNLSIMSVPLNLVSLITNQRATIELQFNIRVALSNEDALQPLRVILTVTDGSVFNNYLFQINVRMK